MAKRGQLTPEIEKLSQKLLGYPVGLIELRLMPYIQYLMMNEQVIAPARVNAEEREILSKWRAAGHIEGGASGLAITKEFWDIINEILWLGYVAYRDFESPDPEPRATEKDAA